APYGRVPGAQPLAADWYRGDGPMARTVADAALLARVMVGLHPSDHATIDSTGFLDGFDPTSVEAADRLRGRRVALCLRVGDFPVGEDILANTRTVASALESAGAFVEEFVLPWTAVRVFETAIIHFCQFWETGMHEYHGVQQDTIADY